jgi:RNA polymerase sigma-70 factor (ECF subfamily)
LNTAEARSDAELVASASAGDVGAFETLYLRYRDWTVALAFRFTGDRDLALDVLQETFAYLLRRAPKGLRLDARLTTFLYPVVKHTAMHARRKRGDVVGGVQREEPAACEPTAHGHAAVAAMVDTLPEAQREVLLMRFVADMKLHEIAIALDVPVGTVKSRLRLAVQRLGGPERDRG